MLSFFRIIQESIVPFCQYICTVMTMFFLYACSNTGHHIQTDSTAKHATERRYCLKNRCYQPMQQYNYFATGLASWYGTFENGCLTATGYAFDKNFMTAAHRTLPLPCVVEVTKLSSGQKIKVFVNDRGPFCNPNARIIDLSAAAAKKLGFFRDGITKVSIKCLPYESMLAALYYNRKHYHPDYQEKTTLTEAERKYIKEKIIGDYTRTCESLCRKSKKKIKCMASKKTCGLNNRKTRCGYNKVNQRANRRKALMKKIIGNMR